MSENYTLKAANGTLVVRDCRVQSGLTDPAHAVYDLAGKVFRPKFIDPHAHVLPMGLDLVRPSLAGCRSREEALDRLAKSLESVRPGEWLQAAAYDHNRFEVPEHLTAQDLDSVSHEVPISVRHVSGHAGVVNSVVLRLAKIDRHTPDPTGGVIGRDSEGNPTGVLLERANELLRKVAPPMTVETMRDAILAAGREMSAMNIGSVADMMTGYYDLNSELEAYRLASLSDCPVRLRLYLQWACVFGPRAKFDRNKALRSADPSRCKIAGVKVFIDGALGAKTAAIRGSYHNSALPAKGWSGTLVYRVSRIRQMIQLADAAGYQVSIHAIGDHALDVALNALETCKDPSRHRIEHAMMADDKQISRLANLGVWVCLQPEFLTDFEDAYRLSLGPERMALLNRIGSMEKAGVRVCLGTDRPITRGLPEDVIEAACNRPPGFAPEENMSREGAVLGLTRHAALSMGDTDLGGLAPGDWADWFPEAATG